MAAPTSTGRSRVRRQLRDFVLVWTGITVVMGVCTFIAIYAATGALTQNTGSGSRNNLALPSIPTSTPQVAAINATAIPPRDVVKPPTPTTPPTAESAALAQAASTELPTDALPTPTLLPVRDTRYQVGIQVQQTLNYDPAIQDGWLREVQKLGLSWFKQQIRWQDFEPEKGKIDWGVLDVVMPSAQKFNLKVMLSIVTAPDWARESGVNLDKHGPPADNADYVNFVTQILEKYPGQVQAIEVWNEMNLDREWTSTGGLSAANYVSLLKDTYTAVKAIDPGIIVISGALSPTGFNDGVGAWDDFEYLDQLISAGMLNYVDCVGAHANGYNIGPDQPYDQVAPDPTAKFRGPFDNPHPSWSFYSTIRGYAAAVANAGGNQKICVTEFGWASTEDLDGFPPGFEFANDNTLEEQKTFTIQALDLMKEWDVVWLAFIWNLNYGPQAGWATDNDNVPYSIIGKDYAFRPVYDAIIEWSKTQDG